LEGAAVEVDVRLGDRKPVQPRGDGSKTSAATEVFQVADFFLRITPPVLLLGK
jgi:hypothetical protein